MSHAYNPSYLKPPPESVSPRLHQLFSVLPPGEDLIGI